MNVFSIAHLAPGLTAARFLPGVGCLMRWLWKRRRGRRPRGCGGKSHTPPGLTNQVTISSIIPTRLKLGVKRVPGVLVGT